MRGTPIWGRGRPGAPGGPGPAGARRGRGGLGDEIHQRQIGHLTGVAQLDCARIDIDCQDLDHAAAFALVQRHRFFLGGRARLWGFGHLQQNPPLAEQLIEALQLDLVGRRGHLRWFDIFRPEGGFQAKRVSFDDGLVGVAAHVRSYGAGLPSQPHESQPAQQLVHDRFHVRNLSLAHQNTSPAFWLRGIRSPKAKPAAASGTLGGGRFKEISLPGDRQCL